MKKVKVFMLVGLITVFGVTACTAGGYKQSKEIEVVKKQISSYQKLKYKYTGAITENDALRKNVAGLEMYVDLLEEDNSQLREELFTPEPVKTEAKDIKVVEKIKEVEIVPWYYWAGLVVAILI